MIVAIVEPFGEGHRPMYVGGFWQAFRSIGCSTLFVGPEKIAEEAAASFPPGECSIPKSDQIPWDPLKSLGAVTPEERAKHLWRKLADVLSSRRVDLVFLMSLDSFAPERLPSSQLLNLPWIFSGLWFQPPTLRPTTLREAVRRLTRIGRRFRALRCTACGPVLVLDTPCAAAHLANYASRGIFATPEFSTYERPEQKSATVRNIFRLAGPRRVIALLGSLEPRKGVREFVQAAMAGDAASWAFVLAGRLYRHVFDSDTLALLDEATSGDNPRVLLHDGWLEASELNDIAARASLLFLCYDKWRFSTNMLCKSSFFRVPVLAYQRGYIGRMVQQFDLGFTVGSSAEALQFLSRSDLGAAVDVLRRSSAFASGCDRYQAANSIPAIAGVLSIMRDHLRRNHNSHV